MNSRKYVNETLRREYAELNYFDEILFYGGFDVYEGLRIGDVGPNLIEEGDDWNRVETNHIFTNPRRDLRTVLITVRHRTHLWFHKNICEGRVLSCVSKLRKAAMLHDPREFVVADADVAFGRSLLGWAECQNFGTATFKELQAELVERLRKLELETE